MQKFTVVIINNSISYHSTMVTLIPYSRNFSRTINFAVFVDFTATSKLILKNFIYKCNDNLVDPQNLIREMF